MCVRTGGPKTLGNAGAPLPWDGVVADLIETRSYPTCVITPTLVAPNCLGVDMGPKI